MVQGSTQSQIQQGDLGLDGHEHVAAALFQNLALGLRYSCTNPHKWHEEQLPGPPF